jgi:hypothetical protein
MAYIGTTTVVPAGMTTPLENVKSFKATRLIVAAMNHGLGVVLRKQGNGSRTDGQSVDTLRLSEKAIQFDHPINSGLGPPILFDDSVNLFTENGGMLRLSSEMIQCMCKVLHHRLVAW